MTTWRCVFSPELFRPVHLRRSYFFPSFFNNGALTHSLKSNDFLIRPLNFYFTRITSLCGSENGTSSTSSSSDQKDHEPAQEAVLKAISEVSKTEGRVGKTTNVVIGDVVTDNANSEWLALDQKVNSYPMVKSFTAIGTGGYDFVQSMVVAVESVILQPISEDRVRHRLSSRGMYVSVNIGPVQVISSDQMENKFISQLAKAYHLIAKQTLALPIINAEEAWNVQAAYNATRKDERVKYFL